jgi:hypothetical protein
VKIILGVSQVSKELKEVADALRRFDGGPDKAYKMKK